MRRRRLRMADGMRRVPQILRALAVQRRRKTHPRRRACGIPSIRFQLSSVGVLFLLEKGAPALECWKPMEGNPRLGEEGADAGQNEGQVDDGPQHHEGGDQGRPEEDRWGRYIGN